MADVYHNYIADVEQTEFETARINQYEARFQWFLAPALVLLLAGDRAQHLAGATDRRRTPCRRGRPPCFANAQPRQVSEFLLNQHSTAA